MVVVCAYCDTPRPIPVGELTIDPHGPDCRPAVVWDCPTCERAHAGGSSTTYTNLLSVGLAATLLQAGAPMIPSGTSRILLSAGALVATTDDLVGAVRQAAG